MGRWATLAVLVFFAGGASARAESLLTVPTTEGPVAVTVFAAPGDGPRPTVLILHGREGVRPEAPYRRHAEDLAAAGMNAWLLSYYTPADMQIMLGPGRARHSARFHARIRDWAKKVDEIAAFALIQHDSSRKAGLLGLSNGGFLAVAAAALDPRIAALVVFYGGIPEAMATDVSRLPPLLALHGEADAVIPIAESRALVERAKSLGGVAELVAYPDAGHGFDFDLNRKMGNDARARAAGFLRRWLLDK